MNNKNTYEDGDYLMVSLVDGEGQQPQSSSGPMETGGYGEIVPLPSHKGMVYTGCPLPGVALAGQGHALVKTQEVLDFT